MNRYTECGGFILASNDEKFAVETPHLLPLPEGIDPTRVCCNGQQAIFFGPGIMKDWLSHPESYTTHWLARRPLPPVPKPKTQAELDKEFIDSELARYNSDRRSLAKLLLDIIAYARSAK